MLLRVQEFELLICAPTKQVPNEDRHGCAD